jgi:hypothetical protein
MSHILKRLVELESEILYQDPPDPGQPEFEYIPGSLPVLVSAPHGAVHTRSGKLKFEDEYTAGFCRLIAEMTGIHVLFACRKSGTDPNWYPDVPYKQTLKQVVGAAGIRFVLDIHGASSRHDFGLALGTMAGKSCPDQRDSVLAVLKDYGFAENSFGLDRLDVDHVFKGAGGIHHETVTGFTWHKVGVPAAQVELNAHLRIVSRTRAASQSEPFSGSPYHIEKTVLAIFHLVQALSN